MFVQLKDYGAYLKILKCLQIIATDEVKDMLFNYICGITMIILATLN